MVQFFRNIRRRLIESGRVRRYLAYASGEILLVVIGILIAMQINNWNEDRKLSLALDSSLWEVREDLIQDTMELNRMIIIRKIDFEAQKKVIAVLEGSQPLTNTLYADLARVMLRRNVTLIRNGFDLINEIGLSKLSNISLRNALVVYYNKNQVDVANEVSDDNYEFENVWLPYVREHFREWDFDEIAIPVEDSFILMDTYLLTTLKTNMNNLNGTLNALETAYSSASRLIQSIEAEIHP
ncbi:MAG TPA: DUF6090 family protein [Saprospiraceae bacterium]|nr:hypothetical protein [Saprospiraceae bacterium]HPG09395.1 DUF6090 family protein [Saprospiraceae bacterium]HRV87137.1 DUF6090 family protein [Saprospiraceae bacterium]